MKRYNLLFNTFLFVCFAMFTSCGQDDEYTPTGDATNFIEIEVNDSGIYSQTKAITDGEYKTTFSEGDQIGIFAVLNGNVIETIENICVTYSSARWSFPGGSRIELEDGQENAEFYAYYPYNEDASSLFDPSKADPFEALVGNWVIEDNQEGSNYTKNDLMTGVTEATTINGGRTYRLNFTLEHRMAMAVIKLPSITYNFTNTPALPSYSIELSNLVFQVTTDGLTNTVNPYYDTDNALYRILVQPNTNHTITGEFTQSNQNYTYSFDITGLDNGVFAIYTVDGGSKIISHELKVGDFYYADGSLVSGDTANPDLTNCIGIVYYVGNPQPSVLYGGEENNYPTTQDVLLKEHPNCAHGLVLGLKESTNKFTDVSTEIRAWFRKESNLTDSYIDLGGILWNEETQATGGSGDTAPERDRTLGYNNTQLIRLFAENNPGSYFVLDELDNYDAYPGVSTEWYLPSIGDYRFINPNLTTLNAQMEKVSGISLVAEDIYWTSTERNYANMYFVTLKAGGGNPSAGTGGRKNNDENIYKYRFCLAF